MGPAYSYEEAFLKIFGAIDRSALMDLLHSRPLFGGDWKVLYDVRERFANFPEALRRNTGKYLKRTVELRQCYGTLSAEDFCEWVFLVNALARAVRRKANETVLLVAALRSFMWETRESAEQERELAEEEYRNAKRKRGELVDEDYPDVEAEVGELADKG